MVRFILSEGYVSRKQHDLLNQYIMKCNNCSKTFNSTKAMNYINNNCVPRSTNTFTAEEDYMICFILDSNDFENNNFMNIGMYWPELISIGFNTNVPYGTTWKDLTDAKYSNRYLGRGAKLCDFASTVVSDFVGFIANIKERTATPSLGQTSNILVDYTIHNINDPTADTILKKISAVSLSKVSTCNGTAIIIYGHGVKTEIVY